MTEEQTKWIPELRSKRGVIYCIWNRVTNRRYIGKTVRTFWHRYPCGEWWRVTENIELKTDYHVYGQDAFLVYLLENDIHSEDELLSIEAQYINEWRTMHPFGYNMVYKDQETGAIRMVSQAIENVLKGKRRVGEQMELLGISRPIRRMPSQFCREHSQRMRGTNNPMYGKSHSPKTRDKIRAKAMGREASPETRLKMSKRRGAFHHRSKTVEQVDPSNDRVLMEYGSAREAGRAMGIVPTSISDVCRGRQKTAKGFIWRYKI